MPPVIDRFAEAIVRYVPSNFKHWPPYYTLEEHGFTNGTQLGVRFQKLFTEVESLTAKQILRVLATCIECWQDGGGALKLIGYDVGPKDTPRCNHGH